MNTILKIENPCKKDWDQMKIGLHSRFCDSCQKSVIDFTNKTKEEILEYLLTSNDPKICGRINKSQLDFSNIDILITINSLAKRSPNTNLPFYLLTAATLLFAGINSNTYGQKANIIQLKKDSQKQKNIDHFSQKNINTNINSNCKTEPHKTEPHKTEPHKNEILQQEILTGEIALIDSSKIEQSPYTFVEKMPEFVGGIENLKRFIDQNLIYPSWEKENKIEGTIFVQFVLKETGTIDMVKILNHVEKSKNFNDEVYKLIWKMPKWIPGSQNGKNVSVKYTIPIKFKL